MEQKSRDDDIIGIVYDSDEGSSEVTHINGDYEIKVEDEIEDLLKEDYEDEDEENKGLLSNSNTEERIEVNNSDNVVKPSNKKERQYWIDALRILASYMVVLVHSSSYAIFEVPIFTFNWFGLMFWDAVNRTCVPLFIMISGILFLNPEKEITVSKIFKKYIYRIVKTLIFWNAFYGTVVKYQVNAFKVEYKFTVDIIPDFFSDVIYGKFHMWYLYMCIGLYMITPLLRPITKDKSATKYFIILSMLIVQFLPYIISFINYIRPSAKNTTSMFSDIQGKLMIFFVGGYVCHYVLGYYLSCIEIKNKFLLFLIYVAGIVLLFITYLLKIGLSILKQKEITDFGDYNAINVSLTAIIIFLFFKHTGSKIINRLVRIQTFKAALLKVSQLSFGIYLIHIFYFELFYRLKFHSYSFNSFIFTPIHAFIIWICSFITIYILQYVPYAKDFI